MASLMVDVLALLLLLRILSALTIARVKPAQLRTLCLGGQERVGLEMVISLTSLLLALGLLLWVRHRVPVLTWYQILDKASKRVRYSASGVLSSSTLEALCDSPLHATVIL